MPVVSLSSRRFNAVGVGSASSTIAFAGGQANNATASGSNGTTAYRAYEFASPPTAAETDNAAYVMGLEFYVTQQAWVSHIWFWQPSTNSPSSAARIGALWQVVNGTSGVNLREGVFGTPVPGWNSLAVSPVELTPNVRYRATVLHPAGRYAATPGYFTAGVGSSNLLQNWFVVPNADNTTGLDQGNFVPSAVMAYPTDSFGGANYWTDVSVTSVIPVNIALPATARGSGAAVTPAISAVGGTAVAQTANGTGSTSGAGALAGTVGSTVTHGSQLTTAKVGLTALGLTSSDTSAMTLPSRGYWRTDTSSEFIPAQAYVYNNNPSNKGGTVSAGGMTIDGVFYPAGTQVCQFRNLTGQDFYCSASGTHFLFRGCYKRDTQKAPGTFNMAAGSTGRVSVHYCDLGGAGAADLQYNEVPIKMSAGGGGTILRNYISYTTTAIQVDVPFYDIIENYIEKLTKFYGTSAPPGESTEKHVNGINIIGGQSCIRVLRNYVIGQSPDDAGRPLQDTDCIYFSQFGGPYLGTGTNSDGTVGYQVKDNYVGGTGYCFYLAKNAADPVGTVKNFVFTGNRVTTQVFATGGFYGPVTDVPPWGSDGNVQSDNLWADGASAGQSFV